MVIPSGKKVYGNNYKLVKETGRFLSENELDKTINERLSEVFWDTSGKEAIKQLLSGIDDTSFSSASLGELFQSDVKPKNWQIGEAIAEAYLTDHRECTFPWPTSRDLKNPQASAAGCDLVGFQRDNLLNLNEESYCLVFCEVKTSSGQQAPPGVMTSLRKQVKELRDSKPTKDALIRYLAHRVEKGYKREPFEKAVPRYLKDSTDVSLFGVLIRDVQPNEKDLSAAANDLAEGQPEKTSIEFLAIYLPEQSIESLAARVTQTQGGGS